MQTEEIDPLIAKICYIYDIRNDLDCRRNSARHKAKYYRNIIYSHDMGTLTRVPKKWQNNYDELNKLMLKHNTEYSLIKLKVKRHTLKYKKFVRRAIRNLKMKIIYNCGEVIRILIHFTAEKPIDVGAIPVVGYYQKVASLDKKIIKKIAKEYEANLAIEKLLK